MKITKRPSNAFNQPPLPEGCGILIFTYGNKGNSYEVPVNTVRHFNYIQRDDVLIIEFGKDSSLNFQRSTYGFEDCHRVVRDMYYRALKGDIAYHHEYSADGQRKDGSPLIVDYIEKLQQMRMDAAAENMPPPPKK